MHKITVVDNLLYQQKPIALDMLNDPTIEFIYDDVRHFEYPLSKMDVVINLAAIVGEPAVNKSATNAQSLNADFVKNLVSRLSSNQKLLYMMSTSGYGTGCCDEDSPMNPVSLYGQQKVLGEKYTLEHPNSVSLRLATVFGVSPRMRFDLMINYFVKELVFKDKLSIFEPSFKRNFVHIMDVVRCIDYMRQRNLNGVYNLGMENYSKLDLIFKIADVTHAGKTLPEIQIDEGKDPDQRNCEIINRKILKTGFQFTRSLNNGVCDILRSLEFIKQEEMSTMNNTWIY